MVQDGRVTVSTGVEAQPESAVVRAARLGDPAGFAALVEEHGPAMHRFAVRLLDNHQDAADAVQEAFISAWKSLPDFREDSSLRTWLFTITARRAADIARRRRDQPMDNETLVGHAEDPVRGPAAEGQAAELVSDLRRALATLPWQQRATWLLREVDGLSYAEIAQVISVPESTVRGLLVRSRRTVADAMESWR